MLVENDYVCCASCLPEGLLFLKVMFVDLWVLQWSCHGGQLLLGLSWGSHLAHRRRARCVLVIRKTARLELNGSITPWEQLNDKAPLANEMRK